MSNSSKNEYDYQDPKYKKKLNIWGAVGISIAIIAVVLVIILTSVFLTQNINPVAQECFLGNGSFSKHVVAADSDICSAVGCNIYTSGGNIIDAAIATAFCSGVVNLHSTGIGGGGFMVYYDKASETATFVDFRESAPYEVDVGMYENKLIDKTFGVGSVGVPGFVPGMHYIWKKYGKLPWNKLVEPSRKLLEEGFEFSTSTRSALDTAQVLLGDYPTLKSALTNPATGKYYKAGEIYKDRLLAETFKSIEDDPMDFIIGNVGERFFEDLCRDKNKSECFLRGVDRFFYQIKETTPATRDLGGMTHYTASLPSSATISGFLMKVIEYSGFQHVNKEDAINYSEFLHVYVEAMKFGYAFRRYLGDPTDIPDPIIFNKSLEFLTSDVLAEYIAKYKISLNKVNPNSSYYDILNTVMAQPEDSGTSHFSVLDADGNGVAITTTINGPFGSLIRSPSTGIIYNNEMDDFSSKGDVNLFGFTESSNNFVIPGRRPLSSMSPTVMVDKESKKAVIVSGASGGSRIISSTTQVILNYLYGKMSIYDAMNEPRVHHQFEPNEIRAESKRQLNDIIKDLLIAKGHIFTESSSFASVQSAINENGLLYASSDNRKNGIPSGV